MRLHGTTHGELLAELYIDAAKFAASVTGRDGTSRRIGPLSQRALDARVAAGLTGVADALMTSARRSQGWAENGNPNDQENQ